MESNDDVEPSPPARSRRTLALVLVVVGTLVAFLSIFALWANRQALDTDNWTDASTELLENKTIRDQIALFLVDELYTNVDVAGVIREALPPRADPLAAPAASALRGLIEDRAKIFLGRPRVQEAWQTANRRAHERLLFVIDGGGEVLSTEDGTVTLDLKALLGATAENVGVGGRVESRLPEGAAQITIMESDQLGLAQDVMRLIPKLAVGLVLLWLVLFAAAIWLAGTWRRKAVRACGIGLFVAGAAALLARSAAGDAVVNALASTEAAKPAAAATWTIATTLLDEAAWAGDRLRGRGRARSVARWPIRSGRRHPASAGALPPQPGRGLRRAGRHRRARPLVGADAGDPEGRARDCPHRPARPRVGDAAAPDRPGVSRRDPRRGDGPLAAALLTPDGRFQRSGGALANSRARAKGRAR